MEIFFSSFLSVGMAFIKIFLLGFVGFLGLKFRLLGEQSLKDLSKLLIYIIYPCFIFSNIITRFNPQEFTGWWACPLLQIVLFAIALGLGWIILKVSPPITRKGEFLGLLTFQNASFLPIPLVAVLFPQTAEKYFVYIFLFALSWSALFYSAGIMLLSNKKWKPENLKNIFNPAFIITVVSILLVIARLQVYVPGLVLEPVKIIGDCTVPLAMIVLGGLIYLNFQHKSRLDKRVFFSLAAGKLIILPLLALGAIRLLGLSSALAFIFFLQATMPSATTIAIAARAYDGDYSFIGQSIFYLYIFSIFTVPFYLSLYHLLIGW